MTIPRAIRNLFRRDRRLLGLLARSAYDAIRKTCEATLDRLLHQCHVFNIRGRSYRLRALEGLK